MSAEAQKIKETLSKQTEILLKDGVLQELEKHKEGLSDREKEIFDRGFFDEGLADHGAHPFSENIKFYVASVAQSALYRSSADGGKNAVFHKAYGVIFDEVKKLKDEDHIIEDDMQQVVKWVTQKLPEYSSRSADDPDKLVITKQGLIKTPIPFTKTHKVELKTKLVAKESRNLAKEREFARDLAQIGDAISTTLDRISSLSNNETVQGITKMLSSIIKVGTTSYMLSSSTILAGIPGGAPVLIAAYAVTALVSLASDDQQSQLAKHIQEISQKLHELELKIRVIDYKQDLSIQLLSKICEQLDTKSLKIMISNKLDADRIIHSVDGMRELLAVNMAELTYRLNDLDLYRLTTLSFNIRQKAKGISIDDLVTATEFATLRASSPYLNGLFLTGRQEVDAAADRVKQIELLSTHPLPSTLGYHLSGLYAAYPEQFPEQLPLQDIANPEVWCLSADTFVRGEDKFRQRMPDDFTQHSDSLRDSAQDIITYGKKTIACAQQLNRMTLLLHLLEQYRTVARQIDDFVEISLGTRVERNGLVDLVSAEGDDYRVDYEMAEACCPHHAANISEFSQGFFCDPESLKYGVDLPSVFPVAEKLGLCEIHWASEPDWDRSHGKGEKTKYRRWHNHFEGTWDAERKDTFYRPLYVVDTTTKKTRIADIIWSSYWKFSYGNSDEVDQIKEVSTKRVYSLYNGENEGKTFSGSGLIHQTFPRQYKLTFTAQPVAIEDENIELLAENLVDKLNEMRRQVADETLVALLDRESPEGSRLFDLCNMLEVIRLQLFHLCRINKLTEESKRDFLRSRHKIYHDLEDVLTDNVNNPEYYTDTAEGFRRKLCKTEALTVEIEQLRERLEGVPEGRVPVQEMKVFSRVAEYINTLRGLRRDIRAYQRREKKILERKRARHDMDEVSDDESTELEEIDGGTVQAIVKYRHGWHRDRGPDGADVVLGSGSYGIKVFSGTYRDDDDATVYDVAIKTAPGHLFRDHPLLTASFFRTARRMHRVQSDRVIKLHGATKHRHLADGKTSYSLIMEKGVKSLRDYLDEKYSSGTQLSVEEQFSLVHNIASGLAHIHSLEDGSVHGDLKDSNIIMVEDGDQLIAKVSDFGVRVIQDMASRSTTTTSKRGNQIHWQPPEVIIAKAPMSPEADMFSFALIVWRIVNHGAPLFKRTRDPRALPSKKTALKGLYYTDHTFRLTIPDCHPVLREIIERCWCNLYNSVDPLVRKEDVERMSAGEVAGQALTMRPQVTPR